MEELKTDTPIATPTPFMELDKEVKLPSYMVLCQLDPF
jgi:hypothetical protein